MLYAEPNAFDADLTRRYLAQYAPGVSLDVVGTGEEVMARRPVKAGEGTPAYDLLMLDYRLPGLNALEVVRSVRRERGLRLPIVLVTGHGNEALAVEALRQGCDEYLTKHEGYLRQLPLIMEKLRQQVELIQSEARYRNLYENNQAVMLLVVGRVGPCRGSVPGR